jgi:uncharacterized damage-inducible protein DinB
MQAAELLAYHIEWAAKDTAYNLDFIPDDKLTWKPADTAKSVMEIVNEMVGGIKGMMPALSGGNPSFPPPAFPPATTRAAAKELLLAAAREYAQALRAAAPEAWERPVDMGFGALPLLRAASLPVLELVHHRGQIVYIQTLLGDTQDHFDMDAV